MFTIDVNASTPLYKQLYNYLRNEIMSGALACGSKLMPTRVVAQKYHISRSTVESAYTQLAIEGYISSKERSGHIVLDIKTDPLFKDPQLPAPVIKRPAKKKYRYDFHFANLDSKSFPSSLWRKYTAEALLLYDTYKMGRYSKSQGEPELKIQIINYLKETRGVNCRPEQLLLTSGTQAAIDAICKLFPFEQRTVACEEPGYDAARRIFLSNGYVLFPVETDNKGINISKLKETKTKLTYVIPSHQFPTGAIMPVYERQLLIEHAEENDMYLIEDDYDNELRYNSHPIRSLQSLDKYGRVVYIGSFSKTFSPGLRLAYLILPERLLERYNNVFDRYYCTVPWLTQQTLRLYMENGHWTKHLRRIYTTNKKKHDTLLNCIEKYMGNRVIIHGQNAGLHVMLELPDGRDQSELIKLAQQYSIKIYPTAQYWHNSDLACRNTVMLGFAGISEQEIQEGIKKLSEAWFG